MNDKRWGKLRTDVENWIDHFPVSRGKTCIHNPSICYLCKGKGLSRILEIGTCWSCLTFKRDSASYRYRCLCKDVIDKFLAQVRGQLCSYMWKSGCPERIIKAARPVEVKDPSNWTGHSKALRYNVSIIDLPRISHLMCIPDTRIDGLQTMFQKQKRVQGRR